MRWLVALVEHQRLAFGGVREIVHPDGNRTEITTDAYGRRSTLVDPDAGLQTSTYNAFDELIRFTDARGQESFFYYDLLGRLRSRTDVNPGGLDDVTTWEWDGGATPEAGELIGRLTRTESPDGAVESFRYSENNGLLISQSLLLGGDPFETNFTYDELGRLKTVTYPAGAGGSRPSFEYRYDAYDTSLVGVTEVGADPALADVWSLLEVNAHGQLHKEETRNGVLRTLSYDAAGRLTWNSASANGEIFLQEEVDHDPAGNTSYRHDRVRNQLEFFTYNTYDEITTTNNGDATYSYDVSGNIHPGGPGGPFGYEEPQPHALSTDGTHSYTYDNAGNRIAKIGPTETVHYEYSRSQTLDRVWTESGGEEQDIATFDYDAFGSRRRKVTQDGTTVYGSELYERREFTGTRPTEHHFFITNGQRVVAKLVWVEGGSPRLEYVHDDHLGSPATLTPAELTDLAAQVSHFSYDAFGAQRDPDDWDGGVPPVLSTDQRLGFTGHESDFETDLINMGGRLYDASTRQFLSPDPFVPVPFGIGLNRYAYGLNNPLRYIDPSGYTPETLEFEDHFVYGTPPPQAPPPPITYHDLSGIPFGSYSYSSGPGFAGQGAATSPPSFNPLQSRGPVALVDTSRLDGSSSNERAAAEGVVMGAIIGASLLPGGAGEALDLATLIHSKSTAARVAATVSLALSVLTATLSPNFGAIVAKGASGGKVDDVISETLNANKKNVTSKHTLSADEALEAGERFVGPGYKEIGKPGSGVFRSADGTRQFRMDNNSLRGAHPPNKPHVHLETYAPGASKPTVNNHIPFVD